MKEQKNILLSRRNLLIVLFVVFLFLRLYIDSSYIYMGEDYVKYLEMAKNFPYHTTVNNQMEINHGPFFPYVIHFFTLIFQEDYISIIIISLISASITFFVLYRFFMMLTNNFQITLVILILFTLSVEFIVAFKSGLKEPFVIMLIMLTLYYYVKGVKFNNKKSLIAASIFGGLTALTVDHVILLFPALILSYVFFNYKKINFRTLTFPGLKYAILPVLFIFLVYASWTGAKFYQYSTNEYYPAGLDGDPVSTEGFSLLELLNPRYFEDYDPRITGGFSFRLRDYAFGLGYMFNIVPFDVPRGLNFTSMNYLLFPQHVVYMALIYLPLAFVVLFSIFFILKNFMKTRCLHNNVNLYMIILFLIFVFPLTQWKSSLRYFYTSFIFLYFFISYGLFVLFSQRKKLKLYRKSIVVITIMLLLLIPFWYYQNNNLILFNEKIVLTPNTADFISENIRKDESIMIQTGYNYRLQYLTDRRIVGLTPTPENLLPLIDYYNIDYIIFGKYITWDYYFYSRDSVEYIMSHPDEFKLVASIKEEGYPESGIKADDLYIYRVIKEDNKIEGGEKFIV